MTQNNSYHSKYDEVYGFGACLIVFLVAMIYLLIQACSTQADPLHYNLVFGLFSALLTCAFAYRTQLAWREAQAT